MPEQTNDLTDRALIDLPETRRFVWRDENDTSRDDILVDAINDVSEAITDYCEREFVPTSGLIHRTGSDGVGNGTTTFVSASADFTADDVGSLIGVHPAPPGTVDSFANYLYTIVGVTDEHTVTLDEALPVDSKMTWAMAEARTFTVTPSGFVDLRPFDLRVFLQATLYRDRSDLDVETVTYVQPTFDPRTGTAYALHMAAPAFPPLVTGFATTVVVEGAWGMETVPFGVQLAAKQWVKNIAENPGSYSSTAMSGYTVLPDTDSFTVSPAGMPMAVRQRLEPWRRGFEFT